MLVEPEQPVQELLDLANAAGSGRGASALILEQRSAESGKIAPHEYLYRLVATGGMDHWLRQLAMRASVGATRLG